MLTEFWLVGFQIAPNFKIPIFTLFLLIYNFILIGNLLIIMIVYIGHSLNSPMYFFLSHLSLSDIILTTIIMPNMLYIILNERESITLTGCISQLYLFGSSVTTQCFILTVMSYDRYLAICNPLHYITTMNLKLRLQLTTWSWFSGFFITMIIVTHISQLGYCGPNVIDHFFCDSVPLLQLSCSDISIVQLQELLLGVLVTLFPMAFIVGTYICIFLTIMKISTTTGREKAFFTCSSHLSVVCLYYGSLTTLYVIPTKGLSVNVTKVQSLLYITITPLVNPIIYSLRNHELRDVFSNLAFSFIRIFLHWIYDLVRLRSITLHSP
ncbi:olfactory receptor 10A7-like [Pelobates fuscus]|uniref:olfactory receptor 10A7-like n=1 Tax=Pelobates fuscus TaxID=191477 RepID=UPI002FE4477C